MGLFGKLLSAQKAKNHKDLLDSIYVNGASLNSISENNLDQAFLDTYGSDELCENGNLPCGWVGRHRSDIDSIEEDVVSHVVLARDQSRPVDDRIEEYRTAIELYGMMKERFMALGGCYAKYFSDSWIHCHNSRNDDFEYIVPIEDDLSELLANYEDLKKREELLPLLDERLWSYIKANDGILQSVVYKDFEPVLKSDIQSRLYFWDKEGRIARTKSGSSYRLSCVKKLSENTG